MSVCFPSIKDPYNYLTITVQFGGDFGLNTERITPGRECVIHVYQPILRTSNGGGKYDRKGWGSELYDAMAKLYGAIEVGALEKSKATDISLFDETVQSIRLPSDDAASTLAFDILQSGPMIGIQTVEIAYPKRNVPVWLGNKENIPVLNELWQNAEDTFDRFFLSSKYAERNRTPFHQLANCHVK